MTRPDAPLYVFLGHHKCATGWINSILREACFYLGWRFRIVHRPIDFERHGSLRGYVEAERPRVLAYTNADAAHLAGLPSWRGFHVVRDPRDLLVSAYFSHRYSHPTEGWPELAVHRERLQQVSKDEGLLLEMDFSRAVLDQIGRWDYRQPHVLEVKMEDLSREPVETFVRIFDFWGVLNAAPRSAIGALWRRAVQQVNVLNQRGRRHTPFHWPLVPVRFPQRSLAPGEVTRIVRRKSFRTLSGGRAQGQEDVHSHYRKGTPGDWRNHLNPEHVARFKARYNPLLLSLGYEDDATWGG